MNLYFKEIPKTPVNISASNTIYQLINGLGFRYFWATENLTPNEYQFTPGSGSMTLTELNLHIYDLAYITYITFGGTVIIKKDNFTTFESTRLEILNIYEAISKLLINLNDDKIDNCAFYASKYEQEFPFWYMLNGPISDALTHVGQLISWRRLAQNPQLKGVNVFLGKFITH